MTIFGLIVAGLYGLLVGSFVNALAYRLPRGETLNTRSHCVGCNTQIKAIHNIPIVSFLFLRAKCASCGSPIHWRYPAVELAGAASFVVAAWWGADLLPMGAPLLPFMVGLLWLMGASLALTIIDFEHFLLPTKIIYPTLAAVTLTFSYTSLMADDPGQLGRATLGLLALGSFYGLIWLVAPGAMGFGDVRLALLLGFTTAWVSWSTLLLATFLAFIFAALYGLSLKAKTGESKVPFGPAMIFGVWLALLWGQPIIDMYLSLGGAS